tara:strand:+ start:855 stop:2309 length:1455 start_codon:yes stop_codon:yes gene_type:complete
MINRSLALTLKNNLGTVIEAYEEFLFAEALAGDHQVQAVEGLSTKAIIRTIGSSETSKSRVESIEERVLAANAQDSRSQPSQRPPSQEFQGTTFEAQQARSANQTEGESEKTSKKDPPVWKDIEDCIPCRADWTWGDFNMDELLALLEADLVMRVEFIDKINDMFLENPVLDELCILLHLFEDLCPQDLLAIIALLTAMMASVSSHLRINLKALLKELLGMILKPYFDGLDSFLNLHAQLLIGQADCIINLITVSTRKIAELETSNLRTGETPNSDGTGATRKVFGDQTVYVNDDGESVSRKDFLTAPERAAKYVQNKTSQAADFIIDGYARKIPEGIVALIRQATDWIEFKTGQLQDMIIDIMGGEYLFTNQVTSLLETMRDIATVVTVLKALRELDLDELCNEDSARKVIDRINDSQPDVIVITEDQDQGSPGNTIGTGNPGNGSSGSQDARARIKFTLSSCLQRADSISEEALRQWIDELS